MNKVTISAKNLEVALVKAAGELAIARSEVAHQVSDHSQGFLGLGKKITIQAWPRQMDKKRRQGGRTQRRQAVAKTPMSAELKAEVIAGLKDMLANMLKLAFGIEAPVTTAEDSSLEGSRVIFEVDSAEFAKLLEAETMLADAMEHLMRKQPRYIKRELPFKIFVDAQASRQSREGHILEHAKQAADEVIQSGEAVVLDYQSSYERKLIHLTLGSDGRVVTKSIGHGARKKLMISAAQS